MSIQFYLIKTEPVTFKVSGVCKDLHITTAQLPSYLEKDMIVTLVSGKWPLNDYKDCRNQHLVFQKEDGSQFTMLLDGFTWECAESKVKQQELLGLGHTIDISVEELTSTKENDNMNHPD